MNFFKRKFKWAVLASGSIFIIVILLWFFIQELKTDETEYINVGVLHSLTGTLSISEKSVADATLLAIEEINETGGVLGKQLKPILVDGESNWKKFAEEAERLITEENVSVIFGCWTSACRKTVKPVFEKYDHLLFYPVQYEGLEMSPNIVYTGAAPNQQILPAVDWAFENIGKRFFLVASDYVFPRSANAIIKDRVAELGGEIVGEEYILLGSGKVDEAVNNILKSNPDVILNTINGDTNLIFFAKLRRLGVTPDRIPTISFSLAEEELSVMENRNMIGDYAAWNYFQSIESPKNAAFISNFKERYGSQRVTDDPMEAGYFGVYIWAQAVRAADTIVPRAVREEVKKQTVDAPGGIIKVNSENNHVYKTARIGKIVKGGQFDIVWTSDEPINPEPYPSSRSIEEWDEFLNDLYVGWGNNWANLGE